MVEIKSKIAVETKMNSRRTVENKKSINEEKKLTPFLAYPGYPGINKDRPNFYSVQPIIVSQGGSLISFWLIKKEKLFLNFERHPQNTSEL